MKILAGFNAVNEQRNIPPTNRKMPPKCRAQERPTFLF
jgi:hypothetical protein